VDALLIAVSIVALVPGAATALHLGLLGVASVFYRQPPLDGTAPPVRFLVLIPAYNEEAVLGATLAALNAALRARDRVVVVADRCTDATADIARAFGADVLERPPHSEPGRAAARQAGLEYAQGLEWDAIVMIDADSIVEPGFFDACEAALASGALALQARSEAAAGDRVIDQAALAAATLQGVLMPRGRDRLGLCVRLRGTGMVLDRSLLTRFRFRAPASEDLWYSLDLALEGILPRHVERARLRSVNVGSWKAAGEQRVRYEAGRMSATREFVRPLLRRHDKASLEAAWFLLSPPFAVAAFLLVIAVAAAFLAGAAALGWTAVALFALLCASLALGLVEARVNGRTWLALVIAPWYLPWKAIVQLRALGRVAKRSQHYGATPRA
jgi:glycosyltransferase involved in cell wall biosynthesis